MYATINIHAAMITTTATAIPTIIPVLLVPGKLQLG